MMHRHIVKSFTRKEVLVLARILKRKYNDRLTQQRFMKVTGVTVEVINDLFGNWRRLRRAIGFDRPRRVTRRKRTPRQIVDLLRSIEEQQKGELTQQEFCQIAGLTEYGIRARFGSWRQLRESAGMTRRSKQRRVCTNRELLDPLLKSYLRTGQVPSKWYIEFMRGKPLLMKLKNRFGSWYHVEQTLKGYIEIYFFTRDPEWRKDVHEQTFVPDYQAEVDWPVHTAGQDWSPRTGWVHADKL